MVKITTSASFVSTTEVGFEVEVGNGGAVGLADGEGKTSGSPADVPEDVSAMGGVGV
jgi:hypothetical protein